MRKPITLPFLFVLIPQNYCCQKRILKPFAILLSKANKGCTINYSNSVTKELEYCGCWTHNMRMNEYYAWYRLDKNLSMSLRVMGRKVTHQLIVSHSEHWMQPSEMWEVKDFYLYVQRLAPITLRCVRFRQKNMMQKTKEISRLNPHRSSWVNKRAG